MRQTSRDLPAGIILAGTHTWTNSPFDRLMPRALLPVAHRPLISYALAWMRNGGVNDVTICGNRETRDLEAWFVRQIPGDDSVSYQEDAMPRGAAGSLRDAAAVSGSDTFVVADASAIPNVDLDDLLDRHRRSEASVTVVVHPDPLPDGSEPICVPSGVYIVERSALADVPATGFCDLKERLIPQLYRAGERVIAYTAAGAAPRVLGASTYLVVNDWMVEQITRSAATPSGYVPRATGLIHREAEVAADAVLVGPVLVGPGARVKAKAVIVGPASIGCDATIERGAVVSRSAIWRRSVVGERAIADRCIAADDAIVTPHTHALCSVVVSCDEAMPPASVVRRAPALARATLSARWKPQRVLIGAR